MSITNNRPLGELCRRLRVFAQRLLAEDGHPSASTSERTAACVLVGVATTTPSKAGSHAISATIAVAPPSVARALLSWERATTGDLAAEREADEPDDHR